MTKVNASMLTDRAYQLIAESCARAEVGRSAKTVGSRVEIVIVAPFVYGSSTSHNGLRLAHAAFRADIGARGRASPSPQAAGLRQACRGTSRAPIAWRASTAAARAMPMPSLNGR